MSSPKLLDSSVWIEIFRSGPLCKACQKELKGAEIVVPTLVLYEVYKKIAKLVSEDTALSAIAVMSQHSVMDLNQEVALTAADISLELGLGMADSMVLAHAQKKNAALITLDNDFAKIPNVKVIRG